MAWFVYMLRCGDGSLYTGYTDHVERRLAVHQSGKGAKYTRSHLPVTLVYWEAQPDKSAALRREAAIKRLTRQQKLALIAEKEKRDMTEMRRKDRQMPEALAWEVVDKCEYAFLAMTQEDGTPYGVVINIARDGSEIYFHSAMEGQKVTCMRRQPRVCLTCVSRAVVIPEELTTRYASAIVFGTVEEVTEPEEKVKALHHLCRRYAVPENHAAVRAEFNACVPQTAVWRIKAEAISGKATQK